MEQMSYVNGAHPISSAQSTNFKGNYVQSSATQPQMKEGGEEKMNAALTALGAIGAAGLGLYGLHKYGKGNISEGAKKLCKNLRSKNPTKQAKHIV